MQAGGQNGTSNTITVVIVIVITTKLIATIKSVVTGQARVILECKNSAEHEIKQTKSDKRIIALASRTSAKTLKVKSKVRVHANQSMQVHTFGDSQLKPRTSHTTKEPK